MAQMKKQNRYMQAALVSGLLALGLIIARFVVMFQIYGLANWPDKDAAIKQLDKIMATMHALTVLAAVAALICVALIVLDQYRSSRKG